MKVLRAVVQPCRLRLRPQTAQEGGKGGGGVENEEARGGGGVGGGGVSLENGPGPRPALPWPSNCAKILMTCVYSM